MAGNPYYVETYTEKGKTKVRAHRIPNSQFNFVNLSTTMTTLTYVHRAVNAHHAIAQVCEFAAGKRIHVNPLDSRQFNDALENVFAAHNVKIE